MRTVKLKYRIFLSLALVVAATSFSLAQTTTTPEPDAEKFLGTLREGIYRNDFFKFSMNVPSSFFDLSPDEQTAFKDSGVKLLSEGVKGNRDAWEKAAKAEVILFAISEKGPGSLENSSLLVGAVRQSNGVSSRMVANVSRDFILKSPTFRLVKDTAQVRLANKEFSLFELVAVVTGKTINTKYYVTIHRGHSLTFVITYFKNDSLEKFEKVLNTLAFDSK